MKLLLACIILSASPLQAQVGGNCAIIDCPSNFMPQPVPPNTAARLKVLAALADIKIAETGEIAAAEDLETRTKQIKVELAKNIPWYKPWAVITDDDIKAAELSDPEYLRLMVKHQSAVAASYKAHNEAILKASAAFQLFPPIRDFTGDPRAAGVNMVTKPWLPQYSRHEKLDKDSGQWRRRSDAELDAERRANAVVGGGVNAAQTRGNGVMEFYDQAFTSPEDLAILIYHETSHWVDTAGKSGGFAERDPPSVSFRTEQHAYERAAVFAGQLKVNVTFHQQRADQFKYQAEISETENLTKEQIIADPRFKNWIGKDWAGRLAMTPAESEISPGDEALLQAKMAEAQEAARKAREHQERLEERRRLDEAMPVPVPLHPVRPDGLPLDFVYVNPTTSERNDAIAMNPSYPSLYERQFKYIAKGACSTPEEPFESELTRIDWRRLQKELTKDPLNAPDGLSACEQRVYRRLVEFGRFWRAGSVLAADDVRAEASGTGSNSGGGAIPPTPDHDPVWGKIGPIIRRSK